MYNLQLPYKYDHWDLSSRLFGETFDNYLRSASRHNLRACKINLGMLISNRSTFTAIRGSQIFTLMFICKYFRHHSHIKHSWHERTGRKDRTNRTDRKNMMRKKWHLNLTFQVTCVAGMHKLWYPSIWDTSTWSKFGAHGEHGYVFLFSNLGALWFSENRAPVLGEPCSGSQRTVLK